MFNAAIRETPSSNEGAQELRYTEFLKDATHFILQMSPHDSRFNRSGGVVPGHDWTGVHHPDRLRDHPRSAQCHQEQEALEAGALHVPYARLSHNYFCDLLFGSCFVKNMHHM